MKLYAFVFLLLPFCNYSQEITGYVFVDENNNGIRDSKETGIAGVSVSDQVATVITDANGKYSLQPKGFGFVMISLPDGYKAKDRFWKKISETSIIDFALIKTAVITEFSFVHASDTHISEKSLDRISKLQNAIDVAKPDFVIITGDLVRDALRVSEKEATSYYELFLRETQKIKAQIWNVPGNHEIFGIERHLSLVNSNHPLYGRKMYRHYLGPDYYSFNFGGVHFIGLNSLDYEDLWYYGKIDSVQLEWLKSDVKILSPSTPIVTFQHVPFYSGGLSVSPFEEDGPGRTLEKEKGVLQFRHVVSNTEEVLKILKDHNFPLALGGHYHFQQKFGMAGVNTRFEQTAAVIGASDNGVLKLPSGITYYHVKNGKIDEGKFIPLD